MKVLYHVGEAVDKDTILKKGRIQEYSRPLVMEAKDKNIVLDAIKTVELIKLNGLGTMVKLQNNTDTIFLSVPRIYIPIGTGFAIINYFATKELKYLLDCESRCL